MSETLILISLLAAALVAIVAEQKGRSRLMWAIVSFLFWPLAIVVLILPSQKKG